MYRIPLVIIGAALLVAGAFFFFRGGPGGDSFPAGDTATSVRQNLQGPQARKVPQEKTYRNGIDIAAENFFFTPDLFYVKADQKVIVTLHAVGDQSFVIDELGVRTTAPAGATTVIEFMPDRKGVFRFYSDIPGHREAGQEGVMIAE
ncbi:MAG: cupredoxin domain-containing protein [Patescibacteria group bacterium]